MSKKYRSSRHALVIGGGVSGLTTALCLHSHGIRATLVAEKFAPNITSVVAGALWEWPPAVCGFHHDQISLSRSKHWCMVSYRKFEDLADDPETGAYIRPVTFYFRNLVAEHPFHAMKLNELRYKVRGFAHDPELIQQNGVNPNIGLRDAYTHLAPMVDTDVYMGWLLRENEKIGTRIIQGRITGDLRKNEEALRQSYGADLIINCAGLGAQELASEPMFPLRGAVVRLINDGSRMPKLTEAHCVSHDDITSDQEIVFIVPRGKDRIVLGAIAEANEWSTDIGLDNYEPVRRMYERCMEFLPILREAAIDPAEPVRVGLRPFRKQNVRLEEVPETRIIHNYGHGGAGVTFSWGCGAEVAARADRLLCSERRWFTNDHLGEVELA